MQNELGPQASEFEVRNSQVNIHTLPLFTRAQLSRYNGEDKPQLYVAIKGYVYDVTANAKNYSVGKAYHELVGKDASRFLGLNKLKLPADLSRTAVATWDTSDFDEKQTQSLEKWVAFFKKRYNIVGVVVDHNNKK